MPGPIEFFCPACSHEWKDHFSKTQEYCYYGSRETYGVVQVYCSKCAGGEALCLTE